MLESLVNYGFYSAEDQLKMIPHLLYILDGSTGMNNQNQLITWLVWWLTLFTYCTADIVTGPPQAAYALDKDTNENRPVIKIKNV